MNDNTLSIKGGQGSGNFSHSGRPGKVGGSAPRANISLGVEKKSLVDLAPKNQVSAYRGKASDGTIVEGFIIEDETEPANPVILSQYHPDIRRYWIAPTDEIVASPVGQRDFHTVIFAKAVRKGLVEGASDFSMQRAKKVIEEDLPEDYSFEQVGFKNGWIKVMALVKQGRVSISVQKADKATLRRIQDSFDQHLIPQEGIEEVEISVVDGNNWGFFTVEQVLTGHYFASLPGGNVHEMTLKGGKGSGNFRHSGRPGHVGGSAPKGGIYHGLSLSGGKPVEIRKRGVALSDEEADNHLLIQEYCPESIRESLAEYEAEERVSLWLSQYPAVIKATICQDIANLSGVAYELVNRTLADWAGASNGRESLLFQYAASQEFGIPLSDFQREQMERAGWSPEFLETGKFTYAHEGEAEFYENVDTLVRTVLKKTGGDWLNAMDVLKSVDQGASAIVFKKNGEDVVQYLQDEGLLEFARVFTARADRYMLPGSDIHAIINRAMGQTHLMQEREIMAAQGMDWIMDSRRKVARAMYQRTQAELKRIGVKGEVVVYRGAAHYPTWGRDFRIVGNALESWSFDATEASKFGNVMAMRIPVENIFSLATTGLGCYDEAEVVIFGSVDNHGAVYNNPYGGAEESEETTKGGQGSGNFGHSGRPGKVGGSAPKGGIYRGLTPLEGLSLSQKAQDGSTLLMQTMNREQAFYHPDGMKDKICQEIANEAGVTYDTVNLILREWADSSYGGLALDMHMAVREELGVPGSRYEDELLAHRRGVNQGREDFLTNQIEVLEEDIRLWEEDAANSPARGILETLESLDSRFSGLVARWDREKDDLQGQRDVLEKALQLSEESERHSLSLHELDAAVGARFGMTFFGAMSKAQNAVFGVQYSVREAEYKIGRWKKQLNDIKARKAEGYVNQQNISRDDIRKVVRAMYNQTQAKLKSEGITHLRLYRGLHSVGEIGSGVRAYHGRSIESWAASEIIARRFGHVITADIPIENVFCTSLTGLGCLGEREVVVVGSVIDEVEWLEDPQSE